ncbi:MAG: hypothetical protein Q7K65_03540 [Candidatus Buchananbacteria bacterium]|nr:hypothetical protein [Candidatus Buchananbacteria bacterium]
MFSNAVSDRIRQRLFTIRINYDLTIDQMISLGGYYEIDHDISKITFPIIGSGQMEADLRVFPFDHSVESAEVIAEIKQANCQLAKIEHLLFFGAKYPEVQKQLPISALGSVWQFSRSLSSVASLDVFQTNFRCLRLDYSNMVWDAYRGFLAVVSK